MSRCRHLLAFFLVATLLSFVSGVSAQSEEPDFAAFSAEAQIWIAATSKPEMSDDARTQKVMAEDAFKQKDFPGALTHYLAALNKHSMWPEGHYNAAMLAAEAEDYELAAHHMRRYLVLAPDAKDAQASKDKFLLWQQKAKLTTFTTDVAVIKTSEGVMVFEPWPEVAPNTVENFRKLAAKKFYDGTCFHRVIKGFMIQGGDPLSKDASKESSWGSGGPGYQIKAEFNDRPHTRGVLSMARSTKPDSAGSQFFICHGDAAFLDHQYTTFGKLIKGDDVLDKIGNTKTHKPDRPNQRIDVISIKIVPADSSK